MKRGYVYLIDGYESVINGLPCKPGDWIVVKEDYPSGAQPAFIKLGSQSEAGLDDAGPFTIFS